MSQPSKLSIVFLAIALGGIGAAGWWYSNHFGAPAENTAGSISVASNQTSSMENLVIKDITVGTGAEAKNGDTVTVNYAGTFDDGKKFDSSYDRKQPFSFTLGVGQVIKGWDLGVAGMKAGGKRQLVIPSKLGYGPNGQPPVIPPDATLHFTVELLSVAAK